ncbi:hypothetical protein TSOC_013849 [Tetrabaena socialis]|uniref:Uncharacterized protein n=1 Tax=Tetrabaena socialis TaxID=47790 RepID=A0A2J7ZJ95_9CHLO|nr:hypothetical protein TSOC_013849 [Tetrabaena socialis]|eukprot:PNH00342.1 hypothetical protein TSOC_013849 [Tetrabaena socialis]
MSRYAFLALYICTFLLIIVIAAIATVYMVEKRELFTPSWKLKKPSVILYSLPNFKGKKQRFPVTWSRQVLITSFEPSAIKSISVPNGWTVSFLLNERTPLGTFKASDTDMSSVKKDVSTATAMVIKLPSSTVPVLTPLIGGAIDAYSPESGPQIEYAVPWWRSAVAAKPPVYTLSMFIKINTIKAHWRNIVFFGTNDDMITRDRAPCIGTDQGTTSIWFNHASARASNDPDYPNPDYAVKVDHDTPLGTWFHFVVTVNVNIAKVYVNGSLNQVFQAPDGVDEMFSWVNSSPDKKLKVNIQANGFNSDGVEIGQVYFTNTYMGDSEGLIYLLAHEDPPQ